MYRLKKLSIFVMALFTSAQTICAPIRYQLTDSENTRDCNAVLGALEKARLAAKLDQQICEIMNSPVTDFLRGKDF